MFRLTTVQNENEVLNAVQCTNTSSKCETSVNCKNENCVNKWHQRLGHRNIDAIKQMHREDLAYGLKLNNCKHSTQCTVCIESKLTEMPYPTKAKFRAKNALDLVHSDLCGPMQVDSIGGMKYFLTFIDDF